jgi:hypothetical protein
MHIAIGYIWLVTAYYRVFHLDTAKHPPYRILASRWSISK